jgi:hypothetical protein
MCPHYTCGKAIADGVLIDVSAVAREAGIRYPVALTRAVWQRCVAVPPGVLCQDEAGRLWDELWMLCCAITRQQGSGQVVPFPLHVRSERIHIIGGGSQNALLNQFTADACDRSFEVRTSTPRDPQAWQAPYERFHVVVHGLN